MWRVLVALVVLLTFEDARAQVPQRRPFQRGGAVPMQFRPSDFDSNPMGNFVQGMQAVDQFRQAQQQQALQQQFMAIQAERLRMEQERHAVAMEAERRAQQAELDRRSADEARAQAPSPRAAPSTVPATLNYAAGAWRQLFYGKVNDTVVSYMWDESSTRVLGSYRLVRWTTTATASPLVTDPAYTAVINCEAKSMETAWPVRDISGLLALDPSMNAWALYTAACAKTLMPAPSAVSDKQTPPVAAPKAKSH
jgi:hypothetical protein